MGERYHAITLWQPTIEEMWQPYLAGVLHGDGWCTDRTIGLRVKDREFADAFAACLRIGFGIDREARQDERGYWLLRTSNRRGGFTTLRSRPLRNNDDLSWWLRGFFDSEGNADCSPVRGAPASFSRRIAMYSTNEDTLAKARDYLEWLGVPCLIRPTKNSAGHIGAKTVFELRVLRREGFERFRAMVGSTIPRKQAAIDRIVATYQPTGWQRRNWQKAVVARWGTRHG